MIAAWIRREGVEFETILDGPAETVFYRKFGKTQSARGFGGADLVLCGTSVVSALELFCWRTAKVDGVPTACFLDHWKNYAARFRTDSGFSFPDEVWVIDGRAANLAQRELRELSIESIVVKGNPYADEVVAEVQAREPQQHWGTQILYVAEPGRPGPKTSDLRRIVPEEFDYRTRAHPTDGQPPNRTLVDDLVWADVVVGFDSMALAIAKQAGLRVVSLLRPEEELAIPWAGIELPNR